MDDADPTTPAGASPPPAAPPRRRWRRKLFALVATAVAALVLLVALAPTLLSTRPAVAVILAQVNHRLNGRVEAAAVSLGWTTGVKLDGVRLFDAAGVEVAHADHVTCPMPLWRAATGSFPLGHTVIDGLTFDARVDDQGQLNLGQLARGGGAEPPSGPAAGNGRASKLPAVSGDVELTNAHGTLAQPGKPTVHLTHLAGRVTIPDLNAPITDHLEAALRVGDGGPEGQLTVDGTAAAIRANQLDLDTAAVHQTVDAVDLDLSALQPFLPPSAGIDTLAGAVSAHVAVDVTDGKSAVVDVRVTGTKRLVVRGPALHGDTFATDAFAAAVPKLSIACPNGLTHWQAWRVTVGADSGAPPISLAFDQGHFTLLADVVPRSLLNLADHAAPGSAGRVAFAGHLDAGRLAGQLRHTARVSDQVVLTGGTLDQSLTLTLTPERGTVAAATDLDHVAGSRQGQPVSVQPIHLKVAASDVGGGSALDGLRDLSLTLASRFATADFHGSNVGDLAGTLTAQLQALQAEAAQFHDFGDARLRGDVAVHIADRGQLMRPPYAAQVKADATVTDLRYADATGPRVAEPLVRVDLTGELHGGERSIVERVTDLTVALRAGRAEAAAVDLALAVPTATLGASPSADFKLTRLAVDVPELKRQFANVAPGKAGPVVGSGSLTGTVSGHYDAAGVRLDPSRLTLAHLTVQQQLPDGRRVPAIADDTVNLSVAGTVGLGDAMAARLSDLSLADTAKIFDVHKGDGDLTLTRTKAGFAGTGQVAVMADLASATNIQRTLAQTTAASPEPTARVRSGHLAGTLSLTAPAAGRADIAGRFEVPDLNLATPTGDTGPQRATLAIRAATDASANTLTADEVTFQSPFANAAVTRLSLLLSAPSLLDQLQGATVAVDVPDLKATAALLGSFATPVPAKAGEQPLAPLRVTAGTLSIRADLSHAGTDLAINVPTLAAHGVAFTRGSAAYQAKPITAKLSAVVGTGPGGTLAAQLRGLRVTQLQADAGVATVAMTTPVTVADLSHPAASAAGAIVVNGELADVSQLLAAAAGGKPADAYPYRGRFTLTESLAGGQAVAVKGGVGVAGFKVMQGSAVQFAEDQLDVANDVSLSADLGSIAIGNLSVDMRSSGALDVSIADGSVTDLSAARRLRLPVSLRYDLAKLWPVVHPMLLTPGQPDAYADVKVAGQFTRTLTIGGSYPAGAASTEAIRPLTVDADLAVASLEHGGLTLRDLDVPVALRGGTAVTGKATATANGGQLDVGQVSVDLTADPPRVSVPANKRLLAGATINPLFADTFLNRVINNPVFVGTRDATGLLDVTIVRCDRLPAGALVEQAVPANDGTATVRFSLTELNVGGQGLGAVLGPVLRAINREGNDGAQPDAFKAHVRDATVTLAHGVATEDITFQTGRYNVRFAGDVALASQEMRPLTIGLPGSAIARIFTHDPNVLNAVPASAEVPLTGRLGDVGSYSLAYDRVGQQLIAAAGPKLLGNLLGGKAGGGGASPGGSGPTTRPKDPAAALGDLLNGLGRKGNRKPKK